MFDWYDQPLHTRAPAGGETGLDGTYRRGGEFEPFYVPRPLMPQVDEEDLDSLITFAFFKGVSIFPAERSPSALFFHQRVDSHKVKDMVEAVYLKPILVSRDGFVLDGNHRATAHKQRDEDAECLLVDTDFEEAMQILFAFPKTYVLDATQTVERK